jgi:hypothetical protein
MARTINYEAKGKKINELVNELVELCKDKQVQEQEAQPEVKKIKLKDIDFEGLDRDALFQIQGKIFRILKKELKK